MSLAHPCTPFERIAARYIRYRHSMGYHFVSQASYIGMLCRFLSARRARDLDQSRFEAWSRSLKYLHGGARRAAQYIIYNLCRYRRRTELHCFVPNPLYFAQRRPYRSPVIVTPADVAKILQTIEEMPPRPPFPLRRAVLRLAFILLFTAGLRRAELVKLTLADVDLCGGTLMIRESKFHKSRWVPLSSDALAELRNYLRERLAPPWDISPGSALLGHQLRSVTFRAYGGESFGQILAEIIRRSKVCDPQGRMPRVQDFRHGFAVNALLRWYRAGADVPSQLPKLAIYMGHVSIVSTAHYLHWVPELGGLASAQFERRFGYLIEGVAP